MFEGINQPNPPLNREENFNNNDFEKIKESFTQRLHTILNVQVTVESIGNFADDALDQLLKLNDDVLGVYKKEQKHDVSDRLSTRETEDLAYEYFGLSNIPTVLDKISEIKNRIDKIKIILEKYTEKTDFEITPPEHDKKVGGGEGGFIEYRDIYPRLLTLVYVLETDFNLTLQDDIKITEGTVKPDQFRKEPYSRVDINPLNRIVYICDEEGNASYVFDLEKLNEHKISIINLDLMSKVEKNKIIEKFPSTGIRISQSKNWRDRISDLLNKNIPNPNQPNVDIVEESVPEFKREKIKWLPFHAFQEEVRSIYPKGVSTVMWYREERKKHPNWPSRPSMTYKDNWKNWPELVGFESNRKKEWPPFHEFREEVRSLYPGGENVIEWYLQERRKRPNWPSNPNLLYKNDWQGWPEFVGIENIRKKEWPPFHDFQEEVRSLYPRGASTIKWYLEERKEHPNWPYNPNEVYRNDWQGWSKLVSPNENK